MPIKRNLLAAVVAVGAFMMLAETSHAGWFGSRGSWGSHGSWGSRGSHGSWGTHGSWGSRGSWGGWGSHGSWGSRGSWGSHGSRGSWGSHGSHGSWGTSGGYAVAYPADVYAGRGMIRQQGAVASTNSATSAPRTRLTLHVPADAKVTLAGVATKQTGEVRQFTTTRLSTGQVWDDYAVVVEMEKDGQMLREERIIKLTGGETQELSVNFDSNQIAQR
jgi:uncharacterized protein (TIGR03000 family)